MIAEPWDHGPYGYQVGNWGLARMRPSQSAKKATTCLASLASFTYRVTVTLNMDDSRPPYQQVANRLRAAIRTQELQPGDKLPSQHELASQYGVARMTIQQALRVLRDDGLIVTRQGSGAYVKGHTERSVDLRPRLQEAFSTEQVSIDFCGFSAETLTGALTEPLDRIRSGELHPSSLSVRILVPDMHQPVALPAIVGKTPAESQPARDRLRTIAERSLSTLADMITELSDLQLIGVAKLETRTLATAPTMKTYIINRSDVFQGYYPVRQREVSLSTGPTEIFDPMGKDATLFHFAKDVDPDSVGSLYVNATIQWFDSLWTTIASPL